MKYEYVTKGTCAQKIFLEIDNDKIKNIIFYGGCSGNLKGICSIVKGMNIYEVIDKLKGIKCGNKSTSCPDQLATALEEIINNKIKEV